jgi:hypothetical protein
MTDMSKAGAEPERRIKIRIKTESRAKIKVRVGKDRLRAINERAKASVKLFDDDGNITGVPEEYFLTLPDGTPLNAAVVPNFCRDYLGIDHEELWEVFTEMEVYPADADLDTIFEEDEGWNTKLLPGAHPALNYRGKPVARTKFWLQTDFDRGMARYGYTGWQWRTALAQRRIESVPIVEKANSTLNSKMPDKLKCNHVIGTMYVDGQDNIGAHSDKMGDFQEDSGFIVIKLGCARRFQFGQKDGGMFYDKLLPPGTAVIVGHEANAATVHAVPKDGSCKDASGSLVFRRIATVVPWPKVFTKIRAAGYK